MKTFDIQEAKTHFSAILAMVSAGEQVMIAKAGKLIAVISPHQAPVEKRPFGKYKGQIVIEDSFFEPMGDDFMSHFQ